MQPVIRQQQGRVALLTLNAPPMNLLGHEVIKALETHLADCRTDDRVRAVVLQGGARAFSAGSDLAELASRIQQGKAAVTEKFERDNAIFGALAAFEKPTLCAIEGLAFGGGLELAVCCDFIVGARDARFALPEIKLGAFPGSGGTVRVTQRVGLARARQLMLLGRTINASQALHWGLIDEVSDDGAALEAALEIATELASGPRQAIAACRQSLVSAVELDAEQALALSRQQAVELAFSADVAEGLEAFRAKRLPNFDGGITDE